MRDFLTSNSQRLMEKSMEFLWTKQAAHLDNISNAETPGYRTKTVTFEEEFRERLKQAGRRNLQGRLSLRNPADVRQIIEDSSWTVWEDDEDTRMDGNGVNATEQMVEAVRTAYQLQYTYRSISSDLTALRSAITE